MGVADLHSLEPHMEVDNCSLEDKIPPRTGGFHSHYYKDFKNFGFYDDGSSFPMRDNNR